MQGGAVQERQLTMSVRRDPDGRWRYRTRLILPDGTHVRISGTAPSYENTETAAKRPEAEAIYAKVHAPAEQAQPKPEEQPAKEVPTYAEWFNGRFWNEWVIGERNKPSERR